MRMRQRILGRGRAPQGRYSGRMSSPSAASCLTLTLALPPLSAHAAPVLVQGPHSAALSTGATCELQSGETLLQAMLRAGWAWPHACRNGTCRRCLGHVRAGQIEHTVDWPGLSLEEKRVHCVLPCVARPLGDVTLSPGEPPAGGLEQLT